MVAGAGVGNAAGAVMPFDFGIPKILPGFARTNISGGVFCFGSSAANAVSSGLNSFATTDLLWVGDAAGSGFNGIAMDDAGSNTPLSVATEGVFIVTAGGTVTGGAEVTITGKDNNVTDIVGTGSLDDAAIGRALTAAGSEGFVLVHIK